MHHILNEMNDNTHIESHPKERMVLAAVLVDRLDYLPKSENGNRGC